MTGGQNGTGSGKWSSGATRTYKTHHFGLRRVPEGLPVLPPRSRDNQWDLFQFWSLNTGGAQFAFADGSAVSTLFDASPFLPALANRAGGGRNRGTHGLTDAIRPAVGVHD